jgi:glycosyltransferase involved in cell wall biosynthesis
MAVGLPAVVTDTGGVADAVVDGETGRVVDPGDEAALREAIEWCLADDDRLETMGEDAREHVAERHSWPVVVDRVTAVYERVTGRA